MTNAPGPDKQNDTGPIRQDFLASIVVFLVALPLARPGLLTGAVLGFAHTVGEFGVVLMIGGNIPGETRVLSIAVYEHVEALDYARAHVLSGGLLVLSFMLLLVVYASRFGRKATS